MHAYVNSGAYNVTLTIVDRNGQQNTAAVPITILAPPTVEPTPTSTPAPPELAGTSWSLQTYDKSDTGLSPLVPGTTITAQFGQDDKLTGSSGCNTYQTTYQTGAADALVIMLPVVTGMQCGEPAGVMEQEQAYLGLLPQVTTYRLNANRLELLNGMGKVLLQYAR